MFRLILLTAVYTIVFLSYFHPACAQDVLVVQNYRAKPYTEALQGFKSACRAKTGELILSETNGEDVLEEIRRRKPDLILTIGMDALLQAKKIKGIPILYLMVLHPETALKGEMDITGVSMVLPPEKQLSLLHRFLPGVKKIGMVYCPKNTGHLVARASHAAARMGLEVKALGTRRPEDFPELLKSLKGNVDAYWMLPDSMVITPETVEYLLLFSIRNRVPIITFSEKYLKMGALMSLEVNSFKMGKQAGEMAVKILSGTSVSELKGLEATDANPAINSVIAGKMGITYRSEAVDNLGSVK
jgi:putative ABC transport system substrate-binding protein